ncbi:LPS export ABC transporter periplasmic protein LptC [Pseudomonas benzenivorans]|uniref:Lipopolysaccharide export system protein LptC n=1 Tax=Pseudomonas benzenivorans TaxID=556533 RepID=A0ABY5H379_9PSED|nr:LPS export ABC transporter periplasmic protein LptC [Pseudomonas benzenivorans]UTW06766.1 LPS export ABC transporter periplasmic protein LptC [Pseudomonas benzenivorans]
MLRKLLTPVLFTLAAALLAAVGYWNINPDSFSDRPAAVGTPNAIDFYVVNANTVQYQADGKLHYEMTASKLEHVQASDITLLTEPNMHLYRGSAYPWKIRSARGEVAPEGKEVELIDQVRVDRTDAKGRPTILTTSRLTLFPEKEYAQTQQAVRIDAANGVTTAQGMKAYLNDGRMLLLSNVRGQHEVR